jgi:dienelactone hydrolase
VLTRNLPALALTLATLTVAPAWASAAAATPTPFAKLTCSVSYEKVRSCQGNGSTQRVASWDGVPLDVDVTLPPGRSSGPFPAIVMLNGWGGNKTSFEAESAAGDGSETYDYNNVFYAKRGYLVVNYTARGFGRSCGAGEVTGECAEGFIRLADQRYEARDTEYLLGLLVDEGLVDPSAIGVTGISYGGGQSIELAYLRSRIRCAGAYDAFPGDPCDGEPENSFVPWTSPDGVPLQIAAAYPRWPWSDLASALVPNGRFLDYDPATDGADGSSTSESPVGVPIQSYIAGLYADGLTSGHYEEAGGNPEWDLTKDFALVNAGEPESAEDQELIDRIASFHGGYGLEGTPAPMLLESGWNDDLFPPLQSLRVYDSLRASEPNADVALQFGDVGHSRGSNKPTVDEYFNKQAATFFAAHLRDRGKGPAAGSVTTFTTTCPSSGEDAAADGGPYKARSWQALQRGAVTFGSSGAQTVSFPGGNPKLGTEFDPIAIGEEPDSAGACRATKAEEPPGTASYSLQSEGFTLMGLPTVIANIEVTGTVADDGQLDGRLWDVLPSGEQRLISRGDYRLSEPSTPKVVFQLHGDGYRFEAGDTVKLELTASDSPYYRAGNGPFAIGVRNAEVVLPTLERPNRRQIKAPPTLPLPE